jgi:DNA-binding Lrp family transcriptional regulator
LKLNINERKTLKLLLKDAKISDSDIAKKLKISSQAVGKIRKKLEAHLIKSYSLNLNYSKLGIQTFALALAKLTSDGKEEGELEIEMKLKNEPNIINVYRLPSGIFTHIIMYGFKDISEMEYFFHSPNKKKEIHKYIENQQLFTFSHNSILKNDSSDLFNKMINDMDSKIERAKYSEIEKFRRKLKNGEIE